MADPTVDVLGPVTDLYRDLHQHPELSGQERRTAGRLAQWLDSAGYEVTRNVGGHGVVGLLRSGEGPTVLLRADLDALPVAEATGLPYASREFAAGPDGQQRPVMHACGHDIHVACLAGAAVLLAEAADRWRGTVMVVGQPAEETLSGAEAMLRDGLYRRFGKPDIALAQHVCPLPAGLIAHARGPVTGASAAVRIVVHGRGGHAAAPHLAVDPVLTAASAVVRLQSVVSRESNPSEPLVLTVGSFHAGDVGNVIPDSATLELSVRAFSDAAVDRALAAVDRIVSAECAAAACPAEPEITVVSRAAVNINDRSLAAVVRAAHEADAGPSAVVPLSPSSASEDFPFFGAAGTHLYDGPAVPTVYWMFGGTSERDWAAAGGSSFHEKLASVPANHSPAYAPDPEPTLRMGIRAMTSAALACLDGVG
ncbi:amidohydrolase [Streptomyces sp. NPDC001250]|uniref:amidohydrolase n=1 Tax=unclassified Streptomyces TaxID=2593676 RepID=UPI0033196C4D